MPAFGAAPRRTLYTAMRLAARSLESHPQPTMSARGSQAGNWGKMIKMRATTAALYIPSMGLVLGWPVIARELLNGSM